VREAKEPKNVLANGSFSDGVDAPDGWEWVVLSGRPIWAFDDGAHGRGRTIRIIQDVGSVHGEFRQTVRCRGGRRYLLRGWIKVALQGTGEDSGANLGLKALRGGKEIGALTFRPFFVGREGWQLWSTDYVAPAEATQLAVSFDMRRSDGIAWFSDLGLYETPEPVAMSARPPETRASAERPWPKREKIGLYSGGRDFFGNEFLVPLAPGGVNPDWNVEHGLDYTARFKVEEDARIIWTRKPPNWLSLSHIEQYARKKLVVISPDVFVEAARSKRLTAGGHSHGFVKPCARVETESFLTRGLRKDDIVPWWSYSGYSYSQEHVVANAKVLEEKGFEVVATSVCADKDACGHPVIMWKPVGNGNGILVMDLGPLDMRPTYTADSNVAGLVLSNALGRPQTSLGTYVVPSFDYDDFCEDLHALAGKYPALELKEEGRSGQWRPIYSLAIGPKDAPTFFADAGIHPYEWAPCYGLMLYAGRLAQEYEEGLPWARALLANLRFKCVPIYAPDGWDSQARGMRGVNLNRNFPVYWERYAGTDKGASPLSEPETRTVAGILERENVISAVSWHETSANTNWVGAPGWKGRYKGYARAIPALFRQCIDGSHFYWQASTWTQVTDPRNFLYHYTDSYPYLRDYSVSKEPFQLHYSDSLGITSFLVEQYGNSEMYYSATPQRTDMTCRIVEMLFGLEIGLVCRNHGGQPREVSIPLLTAGEGRAVVYSADGHVAGKRELKRGEGALVAEGTVPPGGCLVVELSPAPWKAKRRSNPAARTRR
jgi:hypothetical protein